AGDSRERGRWLPRPDTRRAVLCGSSRDSVGKRKDEPRSAHLHGPRVSDEVPETDAAVEAGTAELDSGDGRVASHLLPRRQPPRGIAPARDFWSSADAAVVVWADRDPDGRQVLELPPRLRHRRPRQRRSQRPGCRVTGSQRHGHAASALRPLWGEGEGFAGRPGPGASSRWVSASTGQAGEGEHGESGEIQAAPPPWNSTVVELVVEKPRLRYPSGRPLPGEGMRGSGSVGPGIHAGLANEWH